jgi:DNA-3-methyladenine glycosylase II
MSRASRPQPPGNFQIEAALSAADPPLGRIIDAVVERSGQQRPQRSKATPFEALVRAVVYQRMATGAAATIYQKLKATGPGVLTPAKVRSLSTARLRSAGLSASKATYVRNLAEWFSTHTTQARELVTLPDEAVIATLSGISGVGLWTINVFLIFSLQRPDVMPATDLGLRRGVQLMCGLKRPPTPEFVQQRAQLWQPYRSIACVYLWNAIHLKLKSQDLGQEFTA